MIGRPPKQPEERLSVTLRFRVTEQEANDIHVSALRARVSLNQYLRKRFFVEKKVDRS